MPIDDYDKPKLILRAFKSAIMKKLSVTETQVSVAAIPFVDDTWVDFPHFLVVPGHDRVEGGGGHGAHDGGGGLCHWVITVHIYFRRELEMHEGSAVTLYADGEGVEDIKGRLRKAFAMTYFGEGDDRLLYRPLRWTASPATVISNHEEPLLKAAVEFEASYSVSLPTSVTITSADINLSAEVV